MKRILAVTAVIAMVAAACGSSDDVVASVNGVDIVRSQVDILAPETGDESQVADFTRYLSVIIQWEAISQSAAADYDIEPTADEIELRLGEPVAVQGAGATLEEYLAQADASQEGIRQFAKQLIIQDAIQVELSESADLVGDEAVNTELLENPLDWTVVCAAHILVETADEAAEVKARLDAGEAFAAVAAEVSIDPGSAADGGDLGCNLPTGFLEAFATATMEAEIDEVTEPVESEAGFHVILVSQREEATPDVVREAMVRDALAVAVDDWFDSVFELAVVFVDEDIGVWVTDPRPEVLAAN